LSFAGGQMRQAVVFKGEDGLWVAECLSLPGCVSQGQTREEAVSEIREAIRLYIAVLEEDRLLNMNAPRRVELRRAIGPTGG
jgi:predicted RNase H-like HicB family nuclease